MRIEPFTLNASDGKQIYVHRWLPDGTPRALVLIAHGMAEHGARYGRLAEKLCAAGCAVYAPDHRGHGKTAASSIELGFFAEKNGFLRVVEDLHELALAAAQEHPGCKVFLFGHSMGSVIAQVYIGRYGRELSGCALSGLPAAPSAPLAFVGRMVAVLGAALRGKRTKAPALDQMSFGAFGKAFEPLRTKFDWLSRDEAEVDKYIADPLCGFVCSYGFFKDLLDGLTLAYSDQNLAAIPADLSLYLFAGSMDPCGAALGEFEKLRARYAARGIRDLSARLYEGARHEVINETNREEVMADLVAWIVARL